MIRLRDSKGRMLSRPFEERLQEQLTKIKHSENGCWLWEGALTGRGQYASIRDANNKQVRVSRVMLDRAGFPRPGENFVACHTCDTPRCVNPGHLFWGTIKQNARDASRKLRSNKPSGEHLEKIKVAIIKKWKSPEFREKRLRVLAEKSRTPEFRLAVKQGIQASNFLRKAQHDTSSKI